MDRRTFDQSAVISFCNTNSNFKLKKSIILMHPSGKLAVFKAKVKGDPKPEVSWRRAKGLVSDKEKFLQKYDKSTGEHILEVSE